MTRRLAALTLAFIAWPLPANADPAASAKRKTELTVVPFVGGDSDIGFGGGYIGSIARLKPGYEPYLWRLQSATTLTFKPGQDGGGVQVPYVDSFALLTLPHLEKNRWRVELRLSYTRESTLKYYGLGNDSRIPGQLEPGDAFFEHARTHPTLRARSEYSLTDEIALVTGVAYTHNWLEIPPASKLAADRAGADARLASALGPAETHGVVELSWGVSFDDRDHEIAPRRGQHHTLRLDLAPGGHGAFPRRWARVDAALRGYLPLVPRRLTLALRAVSDFLLGAPPFYELPRFDDTPALGGAKGVRGVPAQRYYGKIKVLLNSELRSELFDFDLFGKPHVFGVTAFFDSGRLWADYRHAPELDGDGLGLKIGTGLGVRVQAGESFVLRGDVAWSPDANPVGAYLLGGHIF